MLFGQINLQTFFFKLRVPFGSNIEKGVPEFFKSWSVECLEAVVLLGIEPLALGIKPVLRVRLSLLFAFFLNEGLRK